MPSKSYIEYLLASGRTEEAIECLLVVTLGTSGYAAVVEQSIQYQELQRYDRAGMRTDATLEAWRYRIDQALQALADRACRPTTTPEPAAPSPDRAKNGRIGKGSGQLQQLLHSLAGWFA